MSKKDYQAIARAIYNARTTLRAREATHIVHPSHVANWVTENIADELAADNPRFDRAGFLEACETGKCKGMRG